MRMKRPQTQEQKRSHEQVVGHIPKMKVSRPEPSPQQQPLKSAVAKKRAKPLERDEKRLRALNKLLREIEALQQREADGEALDEQQLAKLARLDDALGEMEALCGGG